MKDTRDYSGLVFTPLEASTATEEYIKEIRSNDGDGMPLYIPGMEYNETTNKGFLPVKRGELITVLGRPGSGKTGFMFHWARRRAQDLKAQKSDKVVLYWTMEQLVEELRLFNVAGEEHISASRMATGKMPETEWDKVSKSLLGMHKTPLWFAGKSLKKRKQDRIQLNEAALRGTLESVEKWQDDVVKQGIDSVFVDYLQRFRSEGKDWVQFYGDLTNGLKDMAGDFTTRMIVGVQARREVDTKAVQQPEMEDGQWTSSIEQQSDGMLSVVRPIRYRKEGEDFGGMVIKGYNQMVIKTLKRKLGPEGQSHWVNFEPEYNKLDDLDVETLDFKAGRNV